MAENNELTEERSEGLIYSSISHGIREEAIDVFEAVSIDRNRLHGLLRSLGTIAVRSSPIQQFGMGLGIGWYPTVLPIARCISSPIGYRDIYSEESAEQRHFCLAVVF
jgi:hypothetical protein